MLYIVSTPIGNISDVSKRTLETLTLTKNIICEDTRRTGILLKSLGIENKKLIVANDFSEKIIINKINLEEDYSLVTDNGTPGISDPGNLVINYFLKNKIKITHIPGPSAFLSALILSGFNSEKFSFYGFLSKKETEIKNTISEQLKRKETIIFYESPHRINKTLEIIKKYFPKLKICIARELTKKFEEILTGTADEIISLNKELLGEIVLIVDGNNYEFENEKISNEYIIAIFNAIKDSQKIDKKEALIKTAELLKINKNIIYDLINKK